MANRWWIYQRERFPLAAHGPLVAAFSFSALSFSALLRGDSRMPDPGAIVVGFVTSLLFFLQLRIADEFKDFEEDSRFRPYRPVPRGLVRLRELAVLFVLSALVQLGLALWLAPRLALLLAGVWVYLGLMSKEFFARDWLKARPVTYMWTHMLIVPMVDFYATACDWWVRGATPPPGLSWFVAVSFLNGFVIEIGRKLRAPADEEEGVQTYTALWGRGRAIAMWMGALLLTALCAMAAARLIGFAVPVGVLLVVVLLAASLVAAGFWRSQEAGAGRRFETVSGLWTLCMYLGLGALPMVTGAWGRG
jgi:4-hydroxybenzoate polyprenyltransferase